MVAINGRCHWLCVWNYRRRRRDIPGARSAHFPMGRNAASLRSFRHVQSNELGSGARGDLGDNARISAPSPVVAHSCWARPRGRVMARGVSSAAESPADRSSSAVVRRRTADDNIPSITLDDLCRRAVNACVQSDMPEGARHTRCARRSDWFPPGAEALSEHHDVRMFHAESNCARFRPRARSLLRRSPLSTSQT